MRLFGRVLEPVERLSEILFGLIMALTVTSAVSVATADDMQIRTMLIAALGCNLAWGIIDAGMYLMARLGERGHNALVGRASTQGAHSRTGSSHHRRRAAASVCVDFPACTTGRNTRANFADAVFQLTSGADGS